MPRTTSKNVIEQTTNYDQFKLLVNNRDVAESHVSALKQAFEEFGNLTVAQPILVNENMEVIDGQHRLIVCRELHAPVFYTMVMGLNASDARNMNLLHRQWGTDDFARSYANSGMVAYQKYLQLREDYPMFSHSIILEYVYGTPRVTGIYKQFREGEFVLADEELARDRLEKLLELRELAPINKPAGLAVLQMLGNPSYDHDRMKRKLATATPRLYQDVRDNLRQFEDIYNSGGVALANQVRFF